MILKAFSGVVAALINVGCQTVASAPPSTSLVEARLMSVQDVTGQPGAPSNCSFEGICIDGAYRLTFRINRNLAGPMVAQDISVTQTSAKPVTGLDYLLVIEHTRDGPTIVWDNLASKGLCMDELAKTYGMSVQAAHYPCRE